MNPTSLCKWNQSPFSIVFLAGHPPLSWPSLPGHFCHPLPWPHTGTALRSTSPYSLLAPLSTPVLWPHRALQGHEPFPSNLWGPLLVTFPSQFLLVPSRPHTLLFYHLWLAKPHPGPISSSAASAPAHRLRSHIHWGRWAFRVSNLKPQHLFTFLSLFVGQLTSHFLQWLDYSQ